MQLGCTNWTVNLWYCIFSCNTFTILRDRLCVLSKGLTWQSVSVKTRGKTHYCWVICYFCHFTTLKRSPSSLCALPVTIPNSRISSEQDSYSESQLEGQSMLFTVVTSLCNLSWEDMLGQVSRTQRLSFNQMWILVLICRLHWTSWRWTPEHGR